MTKKKLPEPSLENRHLYQKLAESDQIIESGVEDISIFYIEHRDDQPRIQRCLENYIRERERLRRQGRTDQYLEKTIQTLLAHIEYDRIYNILAEENTDNLTKGYTIV